MTIVNQLIGYRWISGKYARSGLTESLRKLFRAADFLLLLLKLRLDGRIPSHAARRNLSFIELGPGPTRLASLKRRLFRKVFFVDELDFGIPDPGLRIYDLEKVDTAAKIAMDICAIGPGEPVFLFADHCLEHLPEEAVIRLLNSVKSSEAAACFRVPNLASRNGKRNYLGDPTHQTPFDESMRKRIRDIGFDVISWTRWYRPTPLFRILCGRSTPMNEAEEIAIYCRGKR
jgi:hypothetical protein